MNRTLVAVATSLLAAAPLRAQARVVDEGSFTITVNGVRAGREDFSIKATPGPNGQDTYIAQASVSMGESRLIPRLETNEKPYPVGYDYELRTSEGTNRFRATIARGRLSARIRTPAGESAKEYVVSDNAIVLDDDVFHQYYFLAKKVTEGATANVPVVIPRRNTQVAVRVSATGADAVTIGSTSIPARRLVVAEPGGPERQVWVDTDGRVLRVTIPSRGLVAQRDDPPR
jgi:hypothetical protein